MHTTLSASVTGPVGESLQAGTEDTAVLNLPAPLRRLHDFGAAYTYPDLLYYLLTRYRQCHMPYGSADRPTVCNYCFECAILLSVYMYLM